jgi:hypothetical protein
MVTGIIVGVLAAIIAAEALEVSRWGAERIVVWAARRSRDRNGIDHIKEWLDDLKERPGSTLKLITALWLALGTIVPADWLTLNLPSLWRMALPSLRAAAEARDALRNLLRARFGNFSPDASIGWFHLITVRAVASILPEGRREIYLEEWRAELIWMPRRARTAFCVSLLARSPLLAIFVRLARSRR